MHVCVVGSKYYYRMNLNVINQLNNIVYAYCEDEWNKKRFCQT
jgi:hypothetical protein